VALFAPFPSSHLHNNDPGEVGSVGISEREFNSEKNQSYSATDSEGISTAGLVF